MSNRKRDFKLTEYTRISEPNNQIIAELTKKAIGSRTLTEFAELCGVSTATIFRVINAKIKSQLSDSLIVAIAENASPQSGVTMEMLIAAHGLSKGESASTVTENLTASDAINSTAMYIENMCVNLIRNHLMDTGYSVLKFLRNSTASFDFSINTNALSEHGIDTWHFEVLYTNGGISNPRRLSEKMSQIFEYCYFNSPRKCKEKISLVIDSKPGFDELKRKYGLRKFKDVISIILVDTVAQVILDEYQFSLDESDFTQKIF